MNIATRNMPEQGQLVTVRQRQWAVTDGAVNLIVWNDQPLLALHDETGTTRARLHAYKIGPSLDLQDENGTLRAVVSVGQHGSRLRLIDRNKKWRVGVEHSTTDDQARVIVGDEQGKHRQRNNWRVFFPLTLPSPTEAEGTSDSYFFADAKIRWSAP